MRKNLYLTALLIAMASFFSIAVAQQTTSMGFLFFSGKPSYPHAELNWETIQELTVTHFNLQRSTDGLRFQTISRTTAKGDTSSQRSNKYRFTDANITAISDTGYYRLECVGRDGLSYYSKVVAVPFTASRKLVVMGSTNVQNTLWMTVEVTKQERLVLIIRDQSGRIAARQTWDCIQGIDKKSLDVSSLSTGLYTISVLGGDMDLTSRFIKH